MQRSLRVMRHLHWREDCRRTPTARALSFRMFTSSSTTRVTPATVRGWNWHSSTVSGVVTMHFAASTCVGGSTAFDALSFAMVRGKRRFGARVWRIVAVQLARATGCSMRRRNTGRMRPQPNEALHPMRRERCATSGGLGERRIWELPKQGPSHIGLDLRKLKWTFFNASEDPVDL